MSTTPRSRSVTSFSLAALVAVALVAAACGTGSTTPPTTTSSGGSTTHGTASVAYAGSLVSLAEKVLGPGFEKATGNTFVGRGDGSTTLAQEIKSNLIDPGVFVAVGRDAIETLEPSRAQFAMELATDPLVVAYNPKSKYAPELEAIAKGTKPFSSLFTVLASPGFRLGRTNPNEDPQGAYFIMMVELAQRELGLPATTAKDVLGITASSPYGDSQQFYSETALEPTLQAGELDAASAYRSQAIQLGLPYITLPSALDFADPAYAAKYATVSVTLTGNVVQAGTLISLNQTLIVPPSTTAANAAADESFVSYLLSSQGQAELKAGGYTLVTPQLYLAPGVSASTALPATVQAAFTAAGGQTATS